MSYAYDVRASPGVMMEAAVEKGDPDAPGPVWSAEVRRRGGRAAAAACGGVSTGWRVVRLRRSEVAFRRAGPPGRSLVGYAALGGGSRKGGRGGGGGVRFYMGVCGPMWTYVWILGIHV